MSFGGMVAYEMARHLKPDAVVLIASCRTRDGLRPMYRAASCLLPVVPVYAWSVAKLLAPAAVGVASRFRAVDRAMAVAMFKEMDSRFMHWTLWTLLHWGPTPLEGVPVFQIHGHRDLLIPARRVEADEYIPDGGHLINVTHAEEVNSFISRAAAMSHQIQTFWEDAKAYCSLIDSLANGKPDHFYGRLIACMSRLAKSAEQLPHDHCSREVECSGHRMTHEEWGELLARINHAIGAEVSRLIEADKDYPDSATRVFMLGDELADIYRDLSDGIRFYERGHEDGIKEAVWQWRSFYEHHWGLHLLDALHTVHRIKYELCAE